MTRALAAQAPWWEPGTKHGYHVFTFGWLVGEVVRRVSGKRLGTHWREEIAQPLGLDCHIGLPEEDEARVAEFIAMHFSRVLPRRSRSTRIRPDVSG